jgi:hypothetical protein
MVNDPAEPLRELAVKALRQARKLPIRCSERADLRQRAIALLWLAGRGASTKILERIDALSPEIR